MEDWRDYAICRDPRIHTSVFFPQIKKGTTNSALYIMPRTVCSACTVRTECLLANIEERLGFVGGTTPEQRKELRRLPIRTREAIIAYTERHFYTTQATKQSHRTS